MQVNRNTTTLSIKNHLALTLAINLLISSFYPALAFAAGKARLITKLEEDLNFKDQTSHKNEEDNSKNLESDSSIRQVKNLLAKSASESVIHSHYGSLPPLYTSHKENEVLSRQKRFFENFDLLDTINRQFGPDTFWGNFGNGGSLLAMRTIGYWISGFIYQILLGYSSGESRTYLESLDYLFNRRTNSDNVWRNVRNYSMGMIGRLVFMMAIWGPGYTVAKLQERTANEIANMPFSAKNTRALFGRFLIEGIATILGWAAWAAIGQSGIIDEIIPPRTKNLQG